MNINLNNRQEDIPGESISISEILIYKKFTFPHIIVKLNGTLIKKPYYKDTIVNEGDELHVIHLISGG